MATVNELYRTYKKGKVPPLDYVGARSWLDEELRRIQDSLKTVLEVGLYLEALINPLPSYTVATVPSATTAGKLIYVTDETGGAVPAFSDGTNWRRVTDRAIVS